MGQITLYFIVALITGFIGQYVAKEKNREQGEGFILGFLLSVLGIIIVALLPTKVSIQQPQVTKELTEEEKAVLAEKERKRAEQQIVLNKRRVRVNYILGVVVLLFAIGALVMMAIYGKQGGENPIIY